VPARARRRSEPRIRVQTSRSGRFQRDRRDRADPGVEQVRHAGVLRRGR
jgi:hypothetical protein